MDDHFKLVNFSMLKDTHLIVTDLNLLNVDLLLEIKNMRLDMCCPMKMVKSS